MHRESIGITGRNKEAIRAGVIAPGTAAVTVTSDNVTFRARAISVEANGLTLSFRQP